MRLQDIIMKEAPSAYIFESDGTVHRQRQLEGDLEADATAASADEAGEGLSATR
jgi:hypothetical protein